MGCSNCGNQKGVKVTNEKIIKKVNKIDQISKIENFLFSTSDLVKQKYGRIDEDYQLDEKVIERHACLEIRKAI
jgi:hypothetical protein